MSFSNTRHHTHLVKVGVVMIGGGAPIIMQSMTYTDTADVEKTVAQYILLVRRFRVGAVNRQYRALTTLQPYQFFNEHNFCFSCLYSWRPNKPSLKAINHKTILCPII